MKSLQERYAPRSICFGCGPANPAGLHVASHEEGGEVICRWQAEPHHEAFEGFVSGGVLSAILDCHSNWAAATHLMRQKSADSMPFTVTAEFTVKFQRPTPARSGPLLMRARVVESTGVSATVETVLEAGGQVCATFRGRFVAVREGHPAYHRW